MILEFSLAISGAIIFFLTGAVASYLLFPKCDIIERVAYSIILSVFFATMTGYFLYISGVRNQFFLAAIVSLLLLIFSLVLLRKKNNEPGLYKTFYNKDFLSILLFSLIGCIWRYRFISGVKNWRGIYDYSGIFKNIPIPDIGFYTGMAKDHANYIGTDVLKKIFSYFFINLGALEIFIGIFLYLALIYLLFISYRRSRKLAYIGLILMSLGPIEIFHTSTSFYGNSLSYIALFLLFLFYKTENKKVFWLALSLAIYAAITYYTATVVVLLSSFGFFLASLIKDWLYKKSLLLAIKNILKSKAMGFFVIFAITLVYLIFLSNMKNFTSNSIADTGQLSLTMRSIGLTGLEEIEYSKNDYKIPGTPNDFHAYYSSTLYKDPRILGLSAMGWQILFFILCGATFILYLVYKKNLDEQNLDLLLCLIPTTIVSSGFFYMNYPARIFNYFAFFGLLAITIPKKYYKMFAIISLAFIVSTSVCVANDKKIFWENSNEEINVAKNITGIINGRIFSDQKFVNNLILGGYYNVTGANDNDPLLIGLFYSNDENLFIKSINALRDGGVKYIATTKRMREKYILMLNYPKKNLINSSLYEETLEKVYDDGDVKIYSTNIDNDQDQKNN